MRLHRLLFALLVSVCVPVGVADQAADQARERGFASITKADLIAHIKHLAADGLEGRESGTDGAYKAGEYIAGLFKTWGLKPVGDKGTYFQHFPIGASSGLGPKNHLKVKLGKGAWDDLRIKESYTPFSFSANGAARGQLVFAGYAISAAEERYDDFAGIDVKGKVVLAMRHEPRVDDEETGVFEGATNTHHAYFPTKVLKAQKRGAVAVIIVSNPARTTVIEDELYGHRGKPDKRIKIPVVHVLMSDVRDWLKACGKDLFEIQKGIDKDVKPNSFALDIQVDVSSQMLTSKGSARNVLGLLEGSDPELKDEIVVVGGHYDHVGYGKFGSLAGMLGRNKIHNGADDNASGTSGVLEVAQAFATAKIKPRRSILFMGFSGEEKGLIGSKYYCDHPKFAIEKHVAMINMDMIGRGQTGEFMVNGVGTSPLWPPLAKKINARLKTRAKYGQSGLAPSDNTSFFRKKIPVLFFFTGLHPDYHRPTDDWDMINGDNIQNVARFAFLVAHHLAVELKTRPAFVNAAGPPDMGPGGPFLGIVPGDGTDDGLEVPDVVPGSPADKGGVEPGDRIYRLGGLDVGSIQDLTRVMFNFKVGQEIVIELVRAGRKVGVIVKLAARPRQR